MTLSPSSCSIVSTISDLASASIWKILPHECAAILRTYGDVSPAHFLSDMSWICTISRTRTDVSTRSAVARTSWFGSERSREKVLIESSASSRHLSSKSAYATRYE